MKQVSRATQRKRDSRARQRKLDPGYHAKNAAYAKAYRARKRLDVIGPAVVETQVGGAVEPMNVKQFADKLFVYSQRNDTGDRVIRAKTALEYSKRLLYLTRIIADDSTTSLIDLELFRNVDRVWSLIRMATSSSGVNKGKPWSLSTKIVYMSAIAGTLRRTPGFESQYEQYSKIFSILHKRYDSERKGNRMTPAEEYKFVPWSALDAIWRAEILDLATTSYSIRDLALISLYVGIPPRRAADYQLMYITKPGSPMQRTRNYLVVDRGKIQALVFNAYKTSDRYGTYTIDNIPDDVARVLATYIRETSKNPGDILFPTRTGTRYSAGGFSLLVGNIFKNLTGRRSTVNILRHAAITHFLRKKRTVAERESYALKMGHSITMQAMYDRITPPVNSDDDDVAPPPKLTRTQRRRKARKAALQRRKT